MEEERFVIEKILSLEERDVIEKILSLYVGRCGRRWVGATLGGWTACPVCDDYAAEEQHLKSKEPVAVQPDDFGFAWNRIKALADKLRPPEPEPDDQEASNIQEGWE
jgi:hypothetical protein